MTCFHKRLRWEALILLPGLWLAGCALTPEKSEPVPSSFVQSYFQGSGQRHAANDSVDAGSSSAGAGHPNFDWPVDEARMSRGFLPRKRHPHLGIDLAAPKGTPILCSTGGTVLYTGKEFRGFGKMILVESGGGWATLYAHLDKILVSEGQKVRQGEVIGAMGRTGHATGVHLHFEIRKDRGPVDPLPLLPRTTLAQTPVTHEL
jgi:murein DD-endopeptidase MepM/ murein hydrolase activator NlpD